MNIDAVDYFAESAKKRLHLMNTNLRGFMVGTFLGGAYVGLGILLIFSVGQYIPAPFQKLVMGLIFAIALILVVLAGAELFTGYAMYMTLGVLRARVDANDAIKAMFLCWIGNLMGALFVAATFALAGANGLLVDDGHSLVYKLADYKSTTSASALFARAILCNWLVCLAIWMSAKVDSDVARCVVIFWCLLAFIASGFEHSVANMTLFGMSVIGRGFELQTVFGAIYNLLIVTIGNFVSGSLLVGGMYWIYQQNGAKSSK